jgi:hypothetical protein
MKISLIFFAIILLIGTSSCYWDSPYYQYHSYNKKELQYNTEIRCPQFSYKILIVGETIPNIRQAILETIEMRKRENITDDTTILKFPGSKRDMVIYHITPKKLETCSMLQVAREKYKD